MSQLELPFETTELRIEVRKEYNRKLRLSTVLVTLYEDWDFPVIFMTYTGKWSRQLSSRMVARVHEAHRLRNVRPFGDQYMTPDGEVFYMCE